MESVIATVRRVDGPAAGDAEFDGDVPAIGRTFAERLIDDAVARARRADPERTVTVSTWDEIWARCRALEPRDVAVGRAIRLAFRVARTVDAESGAVAASEPDGGPVSATVRGAPAIVPAVPAVPAMPVAVGRAIPVASGTPPVVVLPAPRRDAGTVRRRRMYVAATWVRNIGLLMILFAAWLLWGTSISNHHAQVALASEFHARVPHVSTTASRPLLPAGPGVAQPPEGTPVAHLQIPAIALDQYVVQGTNQTDLAQGPGHYVGTSMPGQQGNVAIAGHRTTHGAPFDELDQLAAGDRIYLTSTSGRRLTYVVSMAPFAVSPSDVAVLNDQGDNRLTLTTCTPRFFATQRLIVVASLQMPTVSGQAARHRVRYEAIAVGSTGWNWRYLPEVVLAAALLVALGLSQGRIRTRLGKASWVLVTPIWVAGVYFLFVGLSALLPATV